MVKPLIIILANEERAEWHPWSPIEEPFLSIFTASYDIELFIDSLPAPVIAKQAHLVINLLDEWKPPVDSALLNLLLEQDLPLLSIHQGISIARDARLLSRAGGRFISHPPIGSLSFFKDAQAEDKVFSLVEEGYRCEYTDGLRNFLFFKDKEEIYPAGWQVEGKGPPSVWLMPGHSAESFLCPAYGELILSESQRLIASRI